MTYAYDNLNCLLTKTPDASFGAQPVTFAYNASGLRTSMTDPSGTTTYTYDNRNRPLTKTTPEGTLTYTYDAAGNILTASSPHAHGFSESYAFDSLNRASTATDASGVTNYAYDTVGNLLSFSYPNGVSHAYAYDALNRLTQMGASKAGASLSSYAYTLGASGNRLSVAELSGRTVNYAYDNLYRLTGETISGAVSQNGFVAYQYDSVGNRLSLNSTIPALPSGQQNYDANDRLTSDVYDANGNTVNSGGIGNVYDFENHLVQRGAVTIVYDGDGNRISKTAGGVTTKYLVDTNSTTGYTQVLEELNGSTVTRKYTYGLSLISENQNVGNTATVNFYGFDGHGSVRQLTNASGAITDTYTYDAFGNLLTATGSTPNSYKFAGEQFDPDLNLYYNRARYLDVRQGRFWSSDPKEGSKWHPTSFHHFAFGSQDPINRIDRSGNEDIVEVSASISTDEILETNPTATLAGEHALSQAGEIAEIESNVAEGEDIVFKGGRAAEQYLETTLEGEGQVSVQTEQGTRVLDVLTENGEAAESKVGYVRYSERILTQISKDAEILSNHLEGVKDISWNFFRSANTGLRGADPRIISALLNAGIKVVFH